MRSAFVNKWKALKQRRHVVQHRELTIGKRIQAMQGLTTRSLLFSSRSFVTLVSTANVGGMY